MNKLTIVFAALAAAGVTLFTSTGVLALPAPPRPPPSLEGSAADRAVERHLGRMLQRRLLDLHEERAWAMGFR